MDSNENNDFIDKWFGALIGATLLSLVGIFPTLFISDKNHQKNQFHLEFLLSIGIGSQLADVFLHLLPESIKSNRRSTFSVGLWSLLGFLFFYLIERIFSNQIFNQNSINNSPTRGYLNLLANFIDNFNHGAAIGGSFSINSMIGLTTVFSILIHEIPHEIGDFAILLQSGFNRYQAIKAQLLTGSGSLLGASLAIYYSQIFQSTFWVLPFTSGAFIYVSLVQTLPDLIKNDQFHHSSRQIFGLLIGVSLIYLILLFLD